MLRRTGYLQPYRLQPTAPRINVVVGLFTAPVAALLILGVSPYALPYCKCAIWLLILCYELPDLGIKLQMGMTFPRLSGFCLSVVTQSVPPDLLSRINLCVLRNDISRFIFEHRRRNHRVRQLRETTRIELAYRRQAPR